MQISAHGKTTSLGDHDTEQLAATAFDRAAINRAGLDAKTNFPIEKYSDEMQDLQGSLWTPRRLALGLQKYSLMPCVGS